MSKIVTVQLSEARCHKCGRLLGLICGIAEIKCDRCHETTTICTSTTECQDQKKTASATEHLRAGVQNGNNQKTLA